MTDEPEVQVYAHGLPEEITKGGPPHEGPATAVIIHRGCKLVLRFARGDITGEGDLQELWLQPDTEPLEPRVMRRFAPNAELYLAYARSAMRILGTDQGTVEGRWEAFRSAADVLRAVGGPGRGLSDRFYRVIGDQYETLVAEEEPHPVKTLGEIHHVTISAASRWLKEARQRGYIEKEAGRAC